MGFFLCLSQAFVPVDLYQFKNCSSNQIHEISQNGMKALIRYDESKGIKLDENGQNVTLWCESTQPVQKCILWRLNSKGYEKACDYEYPIRCTSEQTYSCKNKRILYEPTNEKRCIFIFDSFEKNGTSKRDIL